MADNSCEECGKAIQQPLRGRRRTRCIACARAKKGEQDSLRQLKIRAIAKLQNMKPDEFRKRYLESTGSTENEMRDLKLPKSPWKRTKTGAVYETWTPANALIPEMATEDDEIPRSFSVKEIRQIVDQRIANHLLKILSQPPQKGKK